MKSRFLILPLLLTFASCGLFRSVTEKNLEVAPQTVRCKFGVEGIYIPTDPSLANMDCIQIREKMTNAWQPAFINGFTFEAGYNYLLHVRIIGPTQNVADDHGSIELISILSKTPVAK
jgi:Domain of unknown function (DUF4377)